MAPRPRDGLGVTFLLAVALRIVLIAWSVYQDKNFAVKYTDIDYFVYTDAARHVARRGSPYERATYRYPPLLAALLTPNVFVHECFGKVLFGVLDVVVGVLLVKILRLRGASARELKHAAWCWLFNPFTCTISTRGSCEALTGTLVLLTVEALLVGKTSRAAVAYGALVHFRLYPIIHVVTFIAFLNEDYDGNRPLIGGGRFSSVRWVTVENVKFGLVSAVTFLALTWGSYAAYGLDYINEAMLYHLQRKDHRHNFASAFYGVYLDSHQDVSVSLSTAAELMHRLASSALPSLIVVSILGVRYARDLPFALFSQTLAFVAFNKVVTAQYFVWWFMLLPLLLPSLARSEGRKQVGFAMMIWLIAQLHWLAWAYALEFKGAQVFEPLWLASMTFFTANVSLLVTFVRTHAIDTVFSRARLSTGSSKKSC